ncbi:MAG: hypothetical protein PHY09_06430 [Desulfuromonadaceae bacterium]|nr:hypothetical protein [Desulfuromonadaceae bacterium]MDD5104082.1 hypothetical protein [Desulfuromonadaceae bacterium]
MNKKSMPENMLKRWFFIAAALLLLAAVAWITELRQRIVLEKSLKELARAQSGLSRLKAASASRRQMITTLQSQLGQGPVKKSPEMVLYEKSEEMQTALKADDMIFSGIAKNGGEASLQFTLTFNNPDYTTLLNTVSSLHTAAFPLTPISSIVVTQSSVKGTEGLSVKVVGKIITIEKAKP